MKAVQNEPKLEIDEEPEIVQPVQTIIEIDDEPEIVQPIQPIIEIHTDVRLINFKIKNRNSALIGVLRLQSWITHIDKQNHYGEELEKMKSGVVNGFSSLKKNVAKVQGFLSKYFTFLFQFNIQLDNDCLQLLHNSAFISLFLMFEANRGIKSSTISVTLITLSWLINVTKTIGKLKLSQSYISEDTESILLLIRSTHKYHSGVAGAKKSENTSTNLIEQGKK